MAYDNDEKIILVVDDDVTSLKLAQKILETEYRVASVNNGEMVFKYLINNRPDLILLDLNMPVIDGFEVIKRLKNKNDCLAGQSFFDEKMIKKVFNTVGITP